MAYRYYKNKNFKELSFPGGPVVKNPPANAGDTVRFLVWEDSTCLKATEPGPQLLSLGAATTKAPTPRARAAPQQQKPLQ